METRKKYSKIGAEFAAFKGDSETATEKSNKAAGVGAKPRLA